MKNVLQYLKSAVSRFPDKTAVEYDKEKYSFLQIYELAGGLASLMQSEEKQKPIAVLTGRNAHVPILFFAAVWSGNFYVPIDPDIPPQKIQSILDDARPAYILGDEETRGVLNGLDYAARFLTLEDSVGIKPAALNFDGFSADTPLYMVYTSGSTGKPKGVLKSHRAVISFAEAYCETFDFSENDVIGNQTPLFFDASAKDLYLMLKTGAALEIIPSRHFAMPADLVDFLNEKGVTFISWVPSALSIVSQLRIFSYSVPKTLKKVFFVGEVMPVKHLNYWRKYLPDVQFVNLYGQSELAGICCYYEVTRTFEASDVLPMGRPLCNCRIYLVNDDKIVTETGVVGEMYIVSDALADEYYNNPQKTEEAFLMKDFGEGPVRCFRTGDLASLDGEGSFVFVSRNDYQIKHMGHRIELGEIEAIAGSLEQIDRCCCLYDGEKSRIVLFCELSTQHEKTTGREIQSLLRPLLSSYMLPSRVVILQKLPLNPNGKIDRQKLKGEL